jgi:bifunctional non-homologous end joining protein LigD
VKNVRAQSGVIGGWLPGAGRRAGGVGSILLGIPEGDGLRFIGSVGTGLSDQMLDDLGRELRGHSRKTSPFNEAIPPTAGKKPHWVDPVLVAEASYAEWGSSGRLRHPVWRGLRDDLSPEDVVDESE